MTVVSDVYFNVSMKIVEELTFQINSFTFMFLGKDVHFRSRLHAIVLKHVWDQLFTVDTIWNLGETGDIHSFNIIQSHFTFQ